MTYLQDKKNKREKITKGFIILTLIAIILFGISGIQNKISPFVANFVKKGNIISSVFGDNKLIDYLKSKNKLVLENKVLNQKVSELETHRIETNIISIENNELRSVLNSGGTETKKTLVKAINDSGLYGTVVISAGKNKNVKSGDLLLGYRGGLIGFVQESYEDASLVRLADSGEEKFETLSLESNSILSTGFESRGVLYADVPRETEIAVGENIVLKNNPTVIVGTIAYVSRDEKDPFKKVLIRLLDQYKYSPYLYIMHK